MAYTDRKELLISWLQTAYSTEQALASTLDVQAERAREFPVLSRQLKMHLEQTRNHADLVRQALERLGTNVSRIKSRFAGMVAELQAQSMGSDVENVFKDANLSWAAENYEIGLYRGIAKLADALGDTQTANTARTILKDEEAMAKWFADHHDEVLQSVLGSFNK